MAVPDSGRIEKIESGSLLHFGFFIRLPRSSAAFMPPRLIWMVFIYPTTVARAFGGLFSDVLFPLCRHIKCNKRIALPLDAYLCRLSAGRRANGSLCRFEWDCDRG